MRSLNYIVRESQNAEMSLSYCYEYSILKFIL